MKRCCWLRTGAGFYINPSLASHKRLGIEANVPDHPTLGLKKSYEKRRRIVLVSEGKIVAQCIIGDACIHFRPRRGERNSSSGKNLSDMVNRFFTMRKRADGRGLLWNSDDARLGRVAKSEEGRRLAASYG